MARISARFWPSAIVSVAVAKSMAAIFSCSALTTLFMVSWTSIGGSVSLSRAVRSSELKREGSLLALFRVMVPMMLRRVVRARRAEDEAAAIEAVRDHSC
jgi:hypothetical protein